MKKKIIVLFPVILLVFGIGIFLFVKTGNKKGIYYDELSDYVKYTYNPLASYGYSTLIYNGKVYTCSSINESLPCSSEEFSNLQVKELSSVYGNHGIFWSTDSADLYETTVEGKLYQLEGYQADNRICLRAYDHSIDIFDCLNDIYLFQGKDLYRDIFHLENAKEVHARISEDTVALVESDDEIFSAFFTALCEGEFIPQENIPDFAYEYDASSECCFLFQDALGIQTEIKIYPNGYVRFVSPENTEFVIRIDKQLCDKVYAKYF